MDLIASGISADSTANMSNSNFTTNSNMTGSNDPISSGYPMSSSGDVLSSSIDLDMKFDHFGESNTMDNQEVRVKKEKMIQKSEEKIDDVEKEFENQHLSDVFVLECHSDPQIRGLVRVCVGNYLISVLDLSHGDYNRWRCYTIMSKDIADYLSVETLMDIILKVSNKVRFKMPFIFLSLGKCLYASPPFPGGYVGLTGQ